MVPPYKGRVTGIRRAYQANMGQLAEGERLSENLGKGT